jgi:hypothetical protein
MESNSIFIKGEPCLICHEKLFSMMFVLFLSQSSNRQFIGETWGKSQCLSFHKSFKLCLNLLIQIASFWSFFDCECWTLKSLHAYRACKLAWLLYYHGMCILFPFCILILNVIVLCWNFYPCDKNNRTRSMTSSNIFLFSSTTWLCWHSIGILSC